MSINRKGIFAADWRPERNISINTPVKQVDMTIQDIFGVLGGEAAAVRLKNGKVTGQSVWQTAFFLFHNEEI